MTLPQVIFEDKYLLVIDKPAGLTVHPGAPQNSLTLALGKPKETVVSWLIRRYPEIKQYNWPEPWRPGIVHRLDKDTSGVLVLALDPQTLTELQKQWQRREVEKTYLALVFGEVNQNGTINLNILRHKDKKKQTVSALKLSEQQKEARTDYYIVRHFALLGVNSKNKIDLTLLKIIPESGRTHQIRVHLKAIGYPVVGDQTYFTKPSKRFSQKQGMGRQFLHAATLKIKHPKTGQKMIFRSPLSPDLQKILEKLTG